MEAGRCGQTGEGEDMTTSHKDASANHTEVTRKPAVEEADGKQVIDQVEPGGTFKKGPAGKDREEAHGDKRSVVKRSL